MYWRYFMWNFAGRQNDIQSNGEMEHGNWLTGFSFIDNARLGDQDLLPDELKENKGHNVFYCLPLLLGLFGLFWQAWYTRKTKSGDGSLKGRPHRHPPVLGGLLPVLHDRSGHRYLPEPDAHAAS